MNTFSIKRTINGEIYEFELNQDELWDAYRVQETLFDKEDVEMFLEWAADDGEYLPLAIGVDLDIDALMKDSSEIGECLRKIRDKQDSYAQGDGAIEEAILDWLEIKKREEVK